MGVAGGWLLAQGIAATDQTNRLFRNGGAWDQAAADRQRRGERLTWIGAGVLGGATLTALGAARWMTRQPDPTGVEARIRRRRLKGLALAGGALVLGATASFLLARSQATDEWISETFAGGGVWDEESARWQTEARTQRWVGSVLAAGATVAAAGAAWMLLSVNSESEGPPALMIGALGRGAGVQWCTTF